MLYMYKEYTIAVVLRYMYLRIDSAIPSFYHQLVDKNRRISRDVEGSSIYGGAHGVI